MLKHLRYKQVYHRLESIRKHFKIYVAITISDICLRQKNNEQFDRHFIEAVVMIYNTQD